MKFDKEAYIKGKKEQKEIFEKYYAYIGYPNCGIDFPVGWNKIVESIFSFAQEKEYLIKVKQIKEKFGGLRFYYDVIGERNEEWDKEISLLEGMGDLTCQWCGEPGEKVSGGWIVTACDEHRKTKYPNMTYEEMRECDMDSAFTFKIARQNILDYQYYAERLKIENDELKEQIVTGFWADEHPEFRQGLPVHEMEEVLTAEIANKLVEIIKECKDESESKEL